MRVVLDTNIVVSGIFFGGIPAQLLRAWSDGAVDIVISPEILAEYERVATRLCRRYPGPDPAPLLTAIGQHAQMVEAPDLPQQVCTDANDDKFLACALAGRASVIGSGDRALLKTSGYSGIRVIRPAALLAEIQAHPRTSRPT